MPKGEWYDYHAKYVAEDTQYLCPGLEGDAEDEIRRIALAAFHAAGCSGWGRVDVMRDRASGKFYLLEVNTAPGMTSHSLVPKAARQVGIEFEELCWRILEQTSLDRDGGRAQVNALLRIVAWILAVALVLLPVVAVLNGWIGAERWPLRTLRVHRRVPAASTRAQLRATVLPYAQRGFFAVRPGSDAQAAVAQLPWVERAEVRKRWPDVLEVRVVEHRPFARWGDDRLLSRARPPVPGARASACRRACRSSAGPTRACSDVVALYNESRALFASSGIDVRALALDRARQLDAAC